jgi:hypothetical protein
LSDPDTAIAKELFDKAESDSDSTVRERAVQIRQHCSVDKDDPHQV